MAIDTITKYAPMLDKVYEKGLLTGDLVPNSILVQASNDANAIKVAKVTSQAMADYNKSTGYVAGTSGLTWETHTFTQDRGRKLTVDNVDNMETAGIAFGGIAADFINVHSIPEIDAYRFSTMFGKAGTTASADLTKSTIDEAIDDAGEVMDDANVPSESRVIYVSSKAYKLIKQSDLFSRTLIPGQNSNRNFGEYDNMKVIKVPKTRFYSKIDLYDGTTGGQEAGGYIKNAATGKDLNFMIVHPSSVIPVMKLNEPKTFKPEDNWDIDAYIFVMRVYHDMFVLDNKVDGIYAHTVA